MGRRGHILEFVEVYKSYGRVRAVRGVSLTVEEGEMLGLVGDNGAGKSTLLQMAAGLFTPDRGELRVFGLPYRDNHAAILSRLGVVFQSRSIDLDISVGANLVFYGNLFGLSGSALSDRIAEVSGVLGFAHLLARPARALSGGNQRRLEVARALLNRPRLLVLDEPTAGLDPDARQAVATHLQRLAHDEGVAILWASHLADEMAMVDRVVHLAAGRVVNPIGAPAFAAP